MIPAVTEMPGPQLADANARARIAGELDVTFVVEAAAGTGKTTALIRRILRGLASGCVEVDGLVAVTFTEKAAGELKLRLRQELERARHDAAADPLTRARLDAALANLEDAHISTIHGFCADLLRERPVEAGIDPLFTVLTEAQARRCFEDACAEWVQSVIEDPPEGVRRALRRSVDDRGLQESAPNGPLDRLRQAAWTLAEWRDFPAAWERPGFDRAAAIEATAAHVQAFAALTAVTAGRDPLFVDTAPARRAGDELRGLTAMGDDDGAEAVLVELARDGDFCRRVRAGRGSAYAPGVARVDVMAAHQGLVSALEQFRSEADADLAALLRDELRPCIEQYERRKARQGALDFLDLLLCARALVRDRREVRAAFQARFQRIFVDEFQDTDPLQAELLLLLAAATPDSADWTSVRPVPGKLFIVGDPKQSIYRFRRADVAVYHQVCDLLTAHGAERLHLTTSFRGVPNLQHAINAAFAPLMTGDRGRLQAAYVPLAPSREDYTGQPSLVALPVPRPYGVRSITATAIGQSTPDAVAAFVEWLVTRSGWMVTERRGAEPVPVRSRHVCLLFRRFVSYRTDVARGYVDALEARNLPHLLVGGRAFHEREEIETLRAALAAVEWPDDELSVFATLRGALFAIPDEALLEYRHRHARGFHPFRGRAPEALPAHLAPIGSALALLKDLHRQRNRRPVADTVHDLLTVTRAHVGFALRLAGEQVLANVLHVGELARQYERAGGISFRGFVEALRAAAADVEATEAPIVEEGSDGVRLMTVHRAKGLEFPVVILADPTAGLAPRQPSRHVDGSRGLCALRIGGWSPHSLQHHGDIERAREEEEGIRLAYVAATRARDLLVVPAVGDAPYESGWVSPLHGALYPPPEGRRTPDVAPGCPPFKGDSVLDRPGHEIASASTVKPGRYRMAPAVPASATPESSVPFDVVWWDPRALRLDVEPPFGLRRQELISKDVAPAIVAAGQRRYEDWREARTAALERGRVSSLRVMTATEWVRRNEMDAAARSDAAAASDPAATSDPAAAFDPAAEVRVITLPYASGRPSGVRFGTLVHAALATIPLDAAGPAIEAVVRTQARIVSAPPEEITWATQVIAQAVAHPVFDSARAAEREGRCGRETPITLLQEMVLIEGVADLVFRDDEGMVVVDFKTDRPEAERLARYRRQVALYATAIAVATGQPARALLLMI